MREGQRHFERLTNMAEQRMMRMRMQLDDRRRGGRSKSRSKSRDRRNDGPTPDGPWMNSGCSGKKLDTLEEGGMFPFQRGMDWCFDMSSRFNDQKDLCCRCDRGDGKEMTDRCWL